MNLDVDHWNFLPNDLNELRYAAIRSLETNCLNPERMCYKCEGRNVCGCTFLHDALNKCGIDDDTFVKLKDWSATYYTYNPRS